jgi:phosphotransferase system enzyme I (PtsI)
MGPFVRLDFADAGRRRPGVDDAVALRAALARAAADLSALSVRIGADAGVLEFPLALIDDETFIDPIMDSLGPGVAAEIAWRCALDGLIAEYGADPSEYVRARRLDVADLRDRVLNALCGETDVVSPEAGAIVIADDLPPSRFLELDWSRGGGLALSRGSVMSHTAMLARARGVPMIVGLGDIPDAASALINAEAGVLLLDPSDEQALAFQRRRASIVARPQRGDDRSPLAFRGEAVRLMLNIEGPENLTHPAAALADGVGLMRTEFLFQRSEQRPDEEFQFQAYASVLRWSGDRPVTIRTVDAGGDKPIPGFSEIGEANPFLGVRGLRLSLRRLDVFSMQLRALGRAAMIGRLKVMFPMVTSPSEFALAEAHFHRMVENLRSEGVEARVPELGMMVEVPVAALSIASFAARFYSLGSNDLAQYVLACDRTNGAVSDLFDPVHPAVLELMRRVVDHGRSARRNVSLCGDIASDPHHAQTLLNCGLREFSMSPNALVAMRNAIQQIASEARLV